MKYKHGLYFDYPEDLHAHMISPKQVRDVALDGKFPYYNKGFWFRVLQVLVQIVMILIVFPANYFRYGLKIKGKSRLIQYRKAFDNGCITVCNHVFEWDYICVRAAMGPKRGYMTVWKDNHNSNLGKMMRAVGSIPIPDTNNIEAMHKFNDDIEKALKEKKMVHFYPEGSMFYYYPVLLPIRKRDAVKARLFSCALIQVVFIGLCFALLPIAINNYNTYSDPNSGIQLAAYTARHFVAAAGFGIIGYAIVDIIYFAFFYRNGKSILASTLVATLVFVVYIFLTTVILPVVPVLEPFFMDLLAGTWLNQIIFFIIALAISVGLNFVAYKIGAKEIEKVDF